MYFFFIVAFLILMYLVLQSMAAPRAPQRAVPVSQRSETYRRHPWARAAEELDLLTIGEQKPTELIGEVNGVRARIFSWSKKDQNDRRKYYTGFEFGPEQGPLYGTSISGDSGVVRLLAGDDFEVGDPDFDRRARIHTRSPTVLRAVLDIETRRRLYQLVNQLHGSVTDGVVHDSLKGTVKEADRIVQHARWIADLAARLSPDEAELPGRLGEIAANDPLLSIRLDALRTLLRHWPDDEETLRVCDRLAHGTADDAVVAEAASVVGATDRLRAIASGGPSEEARGIALRGLVGRVDDGEVSRLAVDALDGGARLDAIRVLQRLGRPQDEPHLFPLLDDDSVEVQTAVIEALSALGTLAAVEPLLPLTKGLLRSSDLKDAARSAVAALQERHGRGVAGDVALVDEAGAGGVAIASEHEVGAVSEVDG